MLDLISEIKQSMRSLLRDRAFTFFSVLALSLGLGLNGSIMVLSRNFLLKDAPAKEPEKILEIKDIWTRPNSYVKETYGSTTAYFELSKLDVFSKLSFSRMKYKASWNTPSGSQDIQAMEASYEYLELLGVNPAMGRFFQKGDTGFGAPDTAQTVISHRFWRRELKGRPDVLGSLVSINGKAHTVIGVLAEGFEGHAFHLGTDLIVPWREKRLIEASFPYRSNGALLARLSPGVSMEQVKAALAALDWGKDHRLEAQAYRPLPAHLYQKLSRGLAGLHIAAFLILGIGLANVMALQAARFQRRQPELALRMALGAKGNQIWRLVLAENLILALLAGSAALGLAAAANPLLEALQAILPYPPKVAASFGVWTGEVTLLIALLTGFLLANLIYLQIRRMDLSNPLKESHTHTGGTKMRGAIVGIQAALALVLLASAGLCLQDLRRQLNIPLGMEIQDRYLLKCEPQKAGRGDDEILPLMPILKERLQQLPGVKGTVLNQGGPILGINTALSGEPRTYVIAANHDLPVLMGMKLREGRWLEKSDEDHLRVLISHEYAQLCWPGEVPLGRRFTSSDRTLEVVGVLQSLRFGGPTQEPEPFFLEPCSLKDGLMEKPLQNITLHAPGNPKAVKAAIQATAKAELKGIPFKLNSLEELRDEKLAQPRQLFFLSAVMGVLALLLSLSGLYGLSAHIAQSRQKEMGLRVVLGATPLKILVELGKGSLLPLLPGLTVGSLLAFGASRWLVSQNEGFPGLSVSVLLMTALILALAAALATLLPAIKAMGQNPAEALRGD